MIEIRRNRPEELQDIIRCANSAFGNSIPAEGFSLVLPKLYGSRAKAPGNHLLAFEEGKLEGLLLVEPMKLKVLDRELKVAAIGTVSVLPDARKKGIMKLLMEEALKEMKEQGYDLAVLTGQRQRYAYWGFECCGMDANFSWEEANLRHCGLAVSAQGLEILPMDENSEWLPAAWQLWEEQPVRTQREKERFYDILLTWRGRPYACVKDGKLAAYLVMDVPEGGTGVRILEMVCSKTVTAPQVLGAIQNCLKRSRGSIAVAPYRQKIMGELEEVCETLQYSSPNHMLILHFDRVLEAMLRLKNSYQPLQESSAVLKILKRDGSEETVRLSVKGGDARAENLRGAENLVEAETLTEEGRTKQGQQEIPTVQMTDLEATRMLFRPSLFRNEALEALPAGWFPLPLHVDELDCC